MLGALLAGCRVYDSALLDDTSSPQASIARPDPRIFEASETCDAGPDATCGSRADAAALDPIEAAACDDADAGSCPDSQSTQQTPVSFDACPDDPDKGAPGICGCGIADVDSDGDGTLDCYDNCPQDPNKTVAGTCGCGQPEVDSDKDGTADCVDACPDDRHKTSVGVCGCGSSDSDQDMDGTADCLDACPQDPEKTSPGMCGCGTRDPSAGEASSGACAGTLLLHRYSFDGSGTALTDSVGSEDGTIYGSNGMLGSGMLTFNGDLGPGYAGEGYAAFPTSMWQGLHSATFELWVNWRGPSGSDDLQWQRLFDFGDQISGQPHTYLCLTPDGDGGVRAAFSLNASDRSAEVYVKSDKPLPYDTLSHVAVVIDEEAATLTLYVDGAMQGSAQLPGKLSDIQGANLWLGRSNYDEDPALFGSIDELRIYGTALTAQALRASFMNGPDAPSP